MGGGSNLVIGDGGFDGLVVQVATERSGHRWRDRAGRRRRRVGLGGRRRLDAGLAGLEALSGIPGSVGGTPIQNVGAYGALTSDVLSAVTVYDRMSRHGRAMGAGRSADSAAHRQSIFKRSHRYVVLDVDLHLARDRRRRRRSVTSGWPIGSGSSWARGSTRSTVRAAVLALRGESGMLLDPADHDTWSVGSFFLNPVVASVPAAARTARPSPIPTASSCRPPG